MVDETPDARVSPTLEMKQNQSTTLGRIPLKWPKITAIGGFEPPCLNPSRSLFRRGAEFIEQARGSFAFRRIVEFDAYQLAIFKNVNSRRIGAYGGKCVRAQRGLIGDFDARPGESIFPRLKRVAGSFAGVHDQRGGRGTCLKGAGRASPLFGDRGSENRGRLVRRHQIASGFLRHNGQSKGSKHNGTEPF